MSVTTSSTPRRQLVPWEARNSATTAPLRPGRTATTVPVSPSVRIVEKFPWPLRKLFSSMQSTRTRRRRRCAPMIDAAAVTTAMTACQPRRWRRATALTVDAVTSARRWRRSRRVMRPSPIAGWASVVVAPQPLQPKRRRCHTRMVGRPRWAGPGCVGRRSGARSGSCVHMPNSGSCCSSLPPLPRVVREGRRGPPGRGCAADAVGWS